MAKHTSKMEQIFDIVVRATGVSGQALKGTSRARRNVVPRQVFCWLAAKYSNISLVDIARFLGGKHHTTIIYHIRKVNDLIDTHDEATIETLDICVNLMRKQNRDTYMIELVLPDNVDLEEVEEFLNSKYIVHKIV